MVTSDAFILDILIDTGLATKTQVQDARAQATSSKGIVDVLVEQGVITEEDISRALAAHASMDFVDISHMNVTQDIIATVPAEIARRYRAVPIQLTDSGLVLATGDPLDFDTFDSLGYLLKRQVEFVCSPPKQIQEAILKYYGTADEAAENLARQIGGEIDINDLESELQQTDSSDAPVIKLVSMLLVEAHKARASDIHLEPLEKRFRVRFRVDGILHEMQNPPKKLQSAIVSRLKIMSKTMSIAEKRLPQDGRIQVKIDGKSIDLRVSTVPTNHGESVVMRILDKSSLTLGLPELGFLSDDQDRFERLITLPDGILLVTGPTGSGKTTTLYASLNYVNKPDRKIITVEDPCEYQMNGINQVQVNSDIGMTFPAALRSILRQAPNIIMIGEIRDRETANIAVNASLTGHLVFSTLHTNDAPSAVARLVDIGTPPFLVSSSVRAILAQRLVRRLCPKCKTPGKLTELEIESLGINASQLGQTNVMQPVGCSECRGLGYKGRMGIFELFVIDDDVRFMINEKASTLELRKRAREQGMRTLREDGVRKVLAGLTTADEVIATTMGDLD